jgi:Esterase-like activity of phytase
MVHPRLLLPLVVFGCALARAGTGVEVAAVGEDPRFRIEGPGVSDLSGLTWTGGDAFAAVSDKRAVVQQLTLKIDRATGRITSGALGPVAEMPVEGGDFEGIAWVAREKAFYLSTEKGPSIIRWMPGTSEVRTLPVPGAFRSARLNLGIESITWDETVRQFWIANEEALATDGPVGSAATGSLVRLQKFDAAFRPLAQYAWRTEPAAFRYGNAGSGVSDLCLLPSGQLLVLERGFAGLGLQLRLFLADTMRATDVSKWPRLEGTSPVVVTKTLIHEEPTAFLNFEGLTLGPPLAQGWRSLILVADSNGAATHTFLALKIRFASKAATPSPPGTGKRPKL